MKLLSLKEQLYNLIHDRVYSLNVSKNVTVAAGKSAVTLTYSLPAGATIISCAIITQPNPNWIHCGIQTLTDTSCVICWNNIYTSSISGAFTIAILYRL